MGYKAFIPQYTCTIMYTSSTLPWTWVTTYSTLLGYNNNVHICILEISLIMTKHIKLQPTQTLQCPLINLVTPHQSYCQHHHHRNQLTGQIMLAAC